MGLGSVSGTLSSPVVSETDSSVWTARQSDGAGPPSSGGGRPFGGGRKRLLIWAAVAVVALIGVVIGLVALSGGSETAAQKAAKNPRPLPVEYVPTPASPTTAKMDSRTKDQRPLDSGEVFGGSAKTLSYKSYTFNLAGSDLTGDCGSVAWGKQLQADLQRFGCTQIARGAYVSADNKYVGQFMTINLATVTGAQAIMTDLNPATTAGFVTPVVGKGSEHFGGGFSVAYSQPFGHYVVISWVERTGGVRPATMSELLDASIAVERADNFIWERLVLVGQ